MGFFKEILSKFQTGVIVFIVFFTSVVLLALPKELAIYLQLNTIIDNYKMYIALAAIIGLAYYVQTTFKHIENKYHKYNYSKNIKKFIETKINKEELDLIINYFYDFNSNVFKSNAVLDIREGTVAALINRGILVQSSAISLSYYHFSLILNPLALDHLNLLVHNKSVSITKKGNTFSYNWIR